MGGTLKTVDRQDKFTRRLASLLVRQVEQQIIKEKLIRKLLQIILQHLAF